MKRKPVQSHQTLLPPSPVAPPTTHGTKGLGHVRLDHGLSSCVHMTEHSVTSGHRILFKMYIQMHSTGAMSLASWSSPTGMSQMAYTLLHTGVAHHVLYRTCTLRWCEQVKHSCCNFWHVLALTAVCSHWLVNMNSNFNTHRPNLWVRQATVQTVALTDETFRHAVSYIALAIE